MSRLPAVLDQTHTDVVRLSAGLVMMGFGTLTAMALTGPAVRRFGGRRVVVAGFALTMLALVTIAVAHSPPALAVAMLGMGVGGGIVDAGMNMQASALERDLGGHLMSRCHGWWSIGSMASAGVGTAAAALPVGLVSHLTGVLVAATVLFTFGVTAFDGTKDAGPDATGTPPRPPARRLAAIGALLFCGAMVEGAAGDWLTVYLHQDRLLTHAGAALWYTVFVSAMAAGRLIAERPHRHFGAVGLVRTGAVVTALSIVLVIAGPTGSWLYLAALGWGTGICWVFPAALSATGTIAAPSAVAAMTAVGYSASVAGPLIIGRLAHSAGLQTAISAMLPLVLAVALFAPALAGADPEPEPPR